MADADIKPPSGWSIERSLQLWRQVQAAIDEDPDLAPDEAVVLAEFQAAHVLTPDEILNRLLDAAVWIDRRIVEADALHREYQERRDRYEARKELVRDTLFGLLGTLERRSHRSRLGKAHIRATQPSVVILDAERLPDDCVKIERTPRKTIIKEHLEAGEDLGGAAVMSNAGEGLYIQKV